MRVPNWLRDDGPWWEPYLGVVALAVAAGLLVALFVLAQAAEITRALRPAGA